MSTSSPSPTPTKPPYFISDGKRYRLMKNGNYSVCNIIPLTPEEKKSMMMDFFTKMGWSWEVGMQRMAKTPAEAVERLGKRDAVGE
jgi:hypothetical protein